MFPTVENKKERERVIWSLYYEPHTTIQYDFKMPIHNINNLHFFERGIFLQMDAFEVL